MVDTIKTNIYIDIYRECENMQRTGEKKMQK